MKHDDIDKLVQAWIVDSAQRPARLDALRLRRPCASLDFDFHMTRKRAALPAAEVTRPRAAA